MKSSGNRSLVAARFRSAQVNDCPSTAVMTKFVNSRSRRSSSSAILLSALLIACGAFLAACGGGNGGSTTVTPAISVALSNPPTSVAAGGTAQLTATVTNDSKNAGVNWSCAPAGSCGSFNPATTASGAPTTYTAPATAPSAGSIMITATSVTDSTKTATMLLTIAAATAISVALTSPPTSVAAGATAPLTATVTNDSANAGVNWSCTPANSCGSFNPATTASGAATTYTAPTTAPTGGTVTVTATSVTDKTKSANATITISTSSTGGLTLGAGTYVFYANGRDTAGHLFGVVGEVQLDGNGKVTAGEQDSSDGNGLSSAEPTADTIAAGTYSLNATGQGTMTLPTNNTNIGVSGTETFSITVVNNKHVLITEFDGSATATGSMDFQTLPANGLTTGGWSFEDVGENNRASYSQGGVFTFNASQNTSCLPAPTVTPAPCSRLTSIVTDFDEATSVGGARQTTLGDGTGSGFFGAPDQFGRGEAQFGGIYWDYYIVGAEVVRMLGYYPPTGAIDQIYLGSAYSQGTAGTTFQASSFTGTFVFTDAGTVLSTTYAAAGLMKFDGASAITGFADVSEGTAGPTSQAISGSYQMSIAPTTGFTTAVNGYGRITKVTGAQDIATIGMYAVDPALNISDPNNTTVSGPGALLVDLSANIDGAGALLAQNSTSGAETANYAVGLQVLTTSNTEVDLVGQAAAASTTLTGTVDVNDTIFGTGQSSAVAFSVTLTADAANAGRSTAPVSLTLHGTAQSFNLVFYQVSSSQFVMFTDATNAQGVGTLQAQP